MLLANGDANETGKNFKIRYLELKCYNSPNKHLTHRDKNSLRDRCRLTFNERKEENGAAEWTNRSVS